jgi:hypothetical protein
MRRIGVVVVALLVLAGCGATGSGGSSAKPIADLKGIASSLEDGGFHCKKPGKPSDDAQLGVGKSPKEELVCTSGGAKFTVERWATNQAADTTMTALLLLACSFGMKNLDYIASANWVGTTDDDKGTGKAQTAAIAKAADATGVKVIHHKCPKGSGTGFDVTTTTEGGPGRKRSDALEVGTTSKIGDYKVTVTEVKPDATAEVQGMSDFNDPPKKGQYLLATYEVTYEGKTEGQPGFELTLALSGSDHVQYDQCDASLGDTDPPTLEHGGKATIKDCVDAPPAAIDGGVLLVKDGFGEHRAYWSIPA